MSRIGKQPVNVPSDIKVNVTEDGKITFKKNANELVVETKNQVNVKLENNKIVFTPKSEDRIGKAFWGTYRALSQNAIEGLTKGYEKKLEINGVGYRANLKGKALELQLGFSHPINYDIPNGITVQVDKNIIVISGFNKQQVGQVAAEIRDFRRPEPYKGKGVKYIDEVIMRKAGKKAKK